MTLKKVVVLAILLRLVFIYVFRAIDNYDLQSYLTVGRLTLEKINIYPQTAAFHHPYFPFFLYIEALSVFLKSYLNPAIFIKSVVALFDIFNLYLIYLLSRKNLSICLIYAVNPITILIATLHGQFDTIPLFYLLLAIFLMKMRRELLAAFAFSAAILVKTWPAFFLILFLKKLKNKRLLLLFPLLPTTSVIVYCLVFGSTPESIISTILGYRSLFSFWGAGKLIHLIFYSRFSQPPIFIQRLYLIFFLIIFCIYCLSLREKILIDTILSSLIFFYVFTPGFSLQYFSWLVPFLILKKIKYWLFLLLVISLYLVFSYLLWTYHPLWLEIITNICGYIVWLAFIFSMLYSKKNPLRTC